MEKKVVIVFVVFSCFMQSDALFRKAIKGNCTDSEFLCDSSLCLPIDKICDNNTDCLDATDEMHCDCIMNGTVPCNNGMNCQTEEAVCSGSVSHCEDYEVTCPESMNETVIIENSTDVFNQTHSEMCSDGLVSCNGGTLCLSMLSACKEDVECDVDCSDIHNETMNNITTTNGVDQDNATEEALILWDISNNSTLEEITIETTTTVDMQIITTENDMLDNSTMIVSVVVPAMEDSENEVKPTDEKNKTEEIDITINEIPDDLLLNVVSTTFPTSEIIEDVELVKEITKLETETAASKQTVSSNATGIYDSVNAASQTRKWLTVCLLMQIYLFTTTKVLH